jgi:hypothetical protein
VRIRLASFYPPPASALLHYLRIDPGDQPFIDRIRAAAARLVANIGAARSLRRLGGLPIANLLDLCNLPLTSDVQAQLDRAVTPVPLYRRAEIALRGVSDAEVRWAIIKDLIAATRYATPALVAILRWTVHAFWEDPEFQALGTGDRLALTWVHANRVLDTFLRRRADPELLTRFFSEGHFDENIADRLNITRFADRDVASSSALSSEAFLFHALGALIGDAPMTDYFDETELEALVASMQVTELDGPAPIPALVLRNFNGQNLLGSFLTAHAAALDTLLGDPAAKRETFGDGALRDIKADRDNGLAWLILMQHARTGLSAEQLVEAQALLRSCDFEGLSVGARDGLPLPRVIVRTIGLLLPTAEYGRALDVIRAVARSAASSDTSPLLSGDDEDGGTIDPVRELLEIAGCYAGIDDADVFERFEAAIVAAVEEWPAAVPSLRLLVDQLIRSNGVIHAEALWRLHLYLNACP